jgi:hypothetical protein
VEFNGLILLAALWFLLSLIGKATQRKPQQGQPPRPREPMRPRALPTGQDATQQEGSRLELVLRELQRSLEDAAGVPAPTRLPPEQAYDESLTLEQEPEIISLEEEVHRRPEEGAHREARRRVDQDDDAAEIETRRIQAAAARDSARVPGRRVIQETGIKQEAADHTAAPGYTTKQLRDAVVWREILGPPVSLRQG